MAGGQKTLKTFGKISSIYMGPGRFQPKQTKGKISKGGRGVESMFAQANMSVFYQAIFNFMSINCYLRT